MTSETQNKTQNTKGQMDMSKKHFIALADAVRRMMPVEGEHLDECYAPCYSTWENMRDALADFCQSQNSRFDRARWLGYIAGENGPNGGQRKVA